jgi:hypothetical protein
MKAMLSDRRTDEQYMTDCECCGITDLYLHEQYPAMDLVTEEWHIICKPCAESDLATLDFHVPIANDESVSAHVPPDLVHLIENNGELYTETLPCGFVVECFTEFALEASVEWHSEMCAEGECKNCMGGE